MSQTPATSRRGVSQRGPLRIDPEVADLAPGYLARRRADVVRLRQALGRHDLDGLAELGHRMKGSGAGYGFPRISQIGAALERAARGRLACAARAEVDRLESELDEIELLWQELAPR